MLELLTLLSQLCFIKTKKRDFANLYELLPTYGIIIKDLTRDVEHKA